MSSSSELHEYLLPIEDELDDNKTRRRNPSTDMKNQNETQNTTPTRQASIHDDSYEVEDMNEWILKANLPPTQECNLRAVLRNAQANQYYEQQFSHIQSRTNMHPVTLCFSNEYEPDYIHYLEMKSSGRTRIVFLVSLGLHLFISVYDGATKDGSDSTLVFLLDYGVAMITLLIGAFSTYFPDIQRRLGGQERITCAVFGIVSIAHIVKKPLGRLKGPILLLFLTLIPISGLTRMRFLPSSILGISVVGIYLTVQLIASATLDGCDSSEAVLYQTFNYAMRVLGGIIAHYRQELLHRRNYDLQLPISGLLEGDSFVRLNKKFAKRELLDPKTLTFRDQHVEAAFSQFWYLIDSSPFASIFNPELHRNAFNTIRRPLASAFLGQVLLTWQDHRVLQNDESIRIGTTFIRLGLVIPAYLCLSGALYWLSCAYADRLSVGVMKTQEDIRHSYVVDTILHDEQSNYVKPMQLISSLTVSIHVAAMAILIVLVYKSTLDGDLCDLYFMGLLNALLFVHRSSFRVRFLYATITTSIMVIGFILLIFSVSFPLELSFEYGIYTLPVLVFASLSSHEEESLRRSFFIYKSIRTLQFQEWFHHVYRVQTWLRRRLHKRLERQRERKHAAEEHDVAVPAKMTKASDLGLYGQVMEVLAGVV